MRKVLALIVLIALVFSLTGCDFVKKIIDDYCGEYADDIPNRNPTGNPNAKYWGYMILESVGELSHGWNIYKDNNTASEKKYFFDDNVMNGYKTIYYFEAPNAWMTYPIRVEDYFAKANIIVKISHLIKTDGEYCQCGRNIHEELPYVPEGQRDYLKYPMISIDKVGDLSSSEIIYLYDLSLISVAGVHKANGFYTYECCYDGEPAFVITSCTELSGDTFNTIFEHIFIME